MTLNKNQVLKEKFCYIRITVIFIFIILVLSPAIGIKEDHSTSQSNSVKISRLASDIKLSTESSGSVYSNLGLHSGSLGKLSNPQTNSLHVQEDMTGESVILEQNRLPKSSIKPTDGVSVASYLENPSFENSFGSNWIATEGSVTQSTSQTKHETYSAYFKAPSWPDDPNITLEQNLTTSVPLVVSPVINCWVYPSGLGYYGGPNARAYIRISFRSFTPGNAEKSLEYAWAGYTGVSNSTSHTIYWFHNTWTANSWNLLFRNITADFEANPSFPDISDYYLYKITISNHYSSGAPPSFYVDAFSITSLPGAKDGNIITNGFFEEGTLDGWVIDEAQISSTSAHRSNHGVYVPRSTASGGYVCSITQDINELVDLNSSLYLHAWIRPEFVGYKGGTWNWAGVVVTFQSDSETRSIYYTWCGSLEDKTNNKTTLSYILLYQQQPNWIANQWNLLYRDLRLDFADSFGSIGIESFKVSRIMFYTHYSNNQPGWFYFDSVGLFQSITKNTGFEEGMTNWTVIDGYSAPTVSATVVADGSQSLFMDEKLSSPYNRGVEQNFPLNKFPLTPSCYLWAYINPSSTTNTGSTWPYAGIRVTFTKYDSSEVRSVLYWWAGNVGTSPQNINVSATWTVNEWNLLFRYVYDDFLTAFATEQASSYGITRMQIIYHFSNYSPGDFYADNIDLLFMDSSPTIVETTEDLTLQFGSSGSLVWKAVDTNPDTYTVYRNDDEIYSSSWNSGVSVTEGIDGLAIGVYNFTIVFVDGSGNTATDEVWVSVEDTTLPVITATPGDQAYELGSFGNFLSWTAVDLDPDSYILYRNGVIINSSSWSSGVLMREEINGLSVGAYNFTIVFSDVSGNKAINECWVSVEDTTAPIISCLQNPSFEDPFGSDWTVTEGSVSRVNSPVNDGTYSAYFAACSWPSVPNRGLKQDLLYNLPLTSDPMIDVWIYPTGLGSYGTTWAGAHITLTFKSYTGGTNVYLVYMWAGYYSKSNSTTTTYFWFHNSWTANTWNQLYRNLNDDFLANPSFPDPDDYYLTSILIRNHYSTASPPAFYVDAFHITSSLGGPNFPGDQTYELGSTGNFLSWIALDLDPANYFLYRNNIQINTSSWISGTPVVENTDGLSVGEYNFTITFVDASGNSVSDELLVIVVDTANPIITASPTDQTIELGSTGNFLSWTATDLDPANYYIYRNNDLINTSSWTSGTPVVEDIDGLSVGAYNFTIMFEDVSGNTITHECWITVEDTTAPIISCLQNPSFEDPFGSDWVVTEGSVSRVNSPVNDGTYSAYFAACSWPSIPNRGLKQDLLYNLSLSSDPMIDVWIYPTGLGSYGTTWAGAHITLTFKSYTGGTNVYLVYMWAGYYSKSNSTTTTYFWFHNSWTANTWNQLYRNLNDDFLANPSFPDPDDYYLTSILIRNHFSTASPPAFYVDAFHITSSVGGSIPPVDQTYELGSTGNFLSWTATDLDPANYHIYRNNEVVNTSSWTSGSSVVEDIDDLSVGEYNFTIVIEDASGNSVSDELLVIVVDTISPVITTTPSDQTIELGSIGNLLSWVSRDLDPMLYSIYRNNELINSSNWVSGISVKEDIDGLPVNTYNFTIVFSDVSGNIVTDEVWVTVDDESVPITTASPPDQTIELGSTGNFLSWAATDLDPGSYTLYRNDVIINSSSWSSGILVIENIDGLVIGEYNFTIVFEDTSGNTAIDEVWVSVEDTTVPVITATLGDQTIELGSTNNFLSWTATDLDPASYYLFRNGELINTSNWKSGTPTIEEIVDLSIGEYNFTIVFIDGSGNTIANETWMDVIDTTTPIITVAPADHTYELGVVGNILIWVASDLDPSSYFLYQNDLQIDTNNWISNVPVIYNIDDLPIGIYNFTITYFDVSGNSGIDDVIVTVEDTIPPVIIISPPDLTFDLDTPVTLFWLTTDLAPDNYSLLQDGNEVTYGLWSNGTIIILTIDQLTPETYNFTIIISDTSGNQVFDSVIVIVKDFSASTSQTTQGSQSSHPTTQPTSGFEFLSLLAMMVTITILNLHRRRKRSG